MSGLLGLAVIVAIRRSNKSVGQSSSFAGPCVFFLMGPLPVCLGPFPCSLCGELPDNGGDKVLVLGRFLWQ